MHVALRLLLSLVFGIAGVAKLRDQAGTRRMLGEFWVPSRFVGPTAALLPASEVLTSLLLLTESVAWWGALGATTLLAIFTIAIAVALAGARRPACRCFGTVQAAPISRLTLMRNLILLAVSGMALATGHETPGALVWLWARVEGSLATVGVLGALGVSTAVGYAMLLLLQQNGRLLLRVEALEQRLGMQPATPPQVGLEVGTPAPAFDLTDATGAHLTLDHFRAAGHPVMLVFTDPGCAPCQSLLPQLAEWASTLRAAWTIAVVSRGPAATDTDELPLVVQLKDTAGAVAARYQVTATPSGVVVEADGRIGSLTLPGAAAIRARLFEGVTASALWPQVAGLLDAASTTAPTTHPQVPA